jgi:hypothetical protein
MLSALVAWRGLRSLLRAYIHLRRKRSLHPCSFGLEVQSESIAFYLFSQYLLAWGFPLVVTMIKVEELIFLSGDDTKG